jgi:hypothetical protein
MVYGANLLGLFNIPPTFLSLFDRTIKLQQRNFQFCQSSW